MVAVGGSFVGEQMAISNFRRAKVLAKLNGRCAYCGVRPKRVHVDHIVPMSKGGSSGLDNLLPACEQCNIVKSDKDLEAFRKNIETRVDRARIQSVDFQVCERYGLIQVRKKPIQFYFEVNSAAAH